LAGDLGRFGERSRRVEQQRQAAVAGLPSQLGELISRAGDEIAHSRRVEGRAAFVGHQHR